MEKNIHKSTNNDVSVCGYMDFLLIILKLREIKDTSFKKTLVSKMRVSDSSKLYDYI